MDNKNKTLFIVLGIFALVIVTTAASFAFFTYSRTGNTKATIISGDIEFSYIEGDSAELTNAFPVDDEIGAIDTTGEYDFQVKLNSSGTTTASYNVYLVDNNTSTNHFTNEQIKFALIKNDVFVANTSATEGVKLSTLDGFNEGTSKGEGIVLSDQEISSGNTDEYKLRIWISDDVSYTNNYQTDGTMDGKYNSYTYSLKVKVTSGIASTIKIGDITVKGSTISAEVSDTNGLSAYAVTQSSSTPQDNEWIEITSGTAKSNVVRTASTLVTKKTISYRVPESGTYYLHIKNKYNETKSKKVEVEIQGAIIVPGSAAEYIMDLAKTNTSEILIDTHPATGQQDFDAEDYRYYGKSPKNYVNFNNEMWRIIGVFDVDDGTGKLEKRVKIIRDASIGAYSWDSSASNINYGSGVNEWSQADMMTLLNSGAYWNRTSGTCYKDSKNSTTSCNFSSTGLTAAAKEMIGNAKWYLGAHSSPAITRAAMYNAERGTLTGKQCTSGQYCTDNVTRKTSWVGKVGLMYPTDYGYAAGFVNCPASTTMTNICTSTNWMFKGTFQWSISPRTYSERAKEIGAVNPGGQFNYKGASDTYNVSTNPTVYLLPDVKIVGGTGTSGTNAYKLSK